MEKEFLTAAGRRPYKMPALLTLHIHPTLMLAASGDPQVGKTSEKASKDAEILVKDDNDYNVWDDDWSDN